MGTPTGSSVAATGTKKPSSAEMFNDAVDRYNDDGELSGNEVLFINFSLFFNHIKYTRIIHINT